jgi:hypothetical protein
MFKYFNVSICIFKKPDYFSQKLILTNYSFIFMKKVLAVLALGAFTLGSCQKERTCTCTVMGETIALPMEKASKGDQEDACNLAQTTYRIADSDATCVLD